MTGQGFGPPPAGREEAQRSPPLEWPDLRTLRWLTTPGQTSRPLQVPQSPFAERIAGDAPRLWTALPVCPDSAAWRAGGGGLRGHNAALHMLWKNLLNTMGGAR